MDRKELEEPILQENPNRFVLFPIEHNDISEIADLQTHPIFSTNPFVIGHPSFRFYAGIPLTTPDGYNVGTLCVLDVVQKRLNESQRFALRTLSKQIINLLKYDTIYYCKVIKFCYVGVFCNCSYT